MSFPPGPLTVPWVIGIPKKKITKLEKPKKEEKSKPLPEVNIGMVGHVDHGKTTLTQALTGKWTDTHSEEVRRGITIRLGYADATFYKCPRCKGSSCYSVNEKCISCFSKCKPVRTVSFVDAPGHETLMATVLSGASIMDGALLVISAHEPCPQPQTREHLKTLDIVGIKNIVVVQNKIDLVTPEEAKKNYKEIKEFLKGSVAEKAPIIPVSAQQGVNIDVLVQAIEEAIPTPKRDPKKEPIMLIARSFDVNKPGTPIKNLKGGVIGGSIIQGELKKGDDIEIRPGIKRGDKYTPVKTKITGLQKSMVDIEKAGPGGLLGVSSELDPSLTRADTLSGNLLGLPGKLPPVLDRITLNVNLLERVVGSKEELKVEPIKTGDMVMFTVNTSKTVGSITCGGNNIEAVLKLPICADKGSRIAISKQIQGRWRLIGWGEIV